MITVKVPAGTQHGTLLSVKGRGMPVHRTLNIRGNLYIKVLVLIPQLSTADLKKDKGLIDRTILIPTLHTGTSQHTMGLENRCHRTSCRPGKV